MQVKWILVGWRPHVALSLLCALLFLPGIAALPPTDRDEARFMQATKQMLETGDVVSIRFQWDLRTKKPVGIHWLQYASVKYLAGRDTGAVWAYRLPSLVAAWLAVLACFAFGRRLFDTETALFGAALLASTFILTVEAHLAKTDAALLLTVVAAQSYLYRLYAAGPDERPHLGVTLGFWVAVGAGLIIKGPVTLGVAGLTAAALCLADRRINWLRGLQPEIGIPVAAAFILPWSLASAAAGNGDVLTASVMEDLIPKLIGGAEGHGAPPGLHTLVSPLTLWPASLFILPGIIVAWHRRAEPAIRFLLAWGGASWLLFELVPTKLPHYVLPAVPALCLAAAAALRADIQLPRWTRGLTTVTSLALGAGMVWAAQTYDGPVGLAGTGLLVCFLFTAAVWLRPQWHRAAIPVTAVAAFAMLAGGVLPRLDALALSPRLRDTIADYAHPTAIPVALARYHEPSAVFWLGTETLLTGARNAAAHVSADPDALAVIAPDQLDIVSDLVDAFGGSLVVLSQIDGYNYAKGREESLILIRSEPEPAVP
jgi:4-amino-4-deoxy-L-arabinose transferase-like glycosyltransferase